MVKNLQRRNSSFIMIFKIVIKVDIDEFYFTSLGTCSPDRSPFRLKSESFSQIDLEKDKENYQRRRNKS